MKINKLTKNQVDNLECYREKWLKIGLSTERVDWKGAKEISDFYYSEILKKAAVPTVVLSSPLSAWVAVCLFGSQVWSQVRSQVGDQVWNQVLDQVRNQVRDQVWSQVGGQVRDQVWNQVRDFAWPYIIGSFCSPVLSFYDCMESLGVNYSITVREKYGWWKRTSQIGLFYPLENICIISDRPSIINMSNKVLHCNGGPAIAYTDGFSVWCLNGVRVTKELAETPAYQLDAHILLRENNAEVRREIVRKIGMERIVAELGAETLDKQGEYELLNFDLGDGRKRPYLKMLNLSIKTWHLEGVPPDIKTVEEALNWRNQTPGSPQILT